MVYSEHSFTSVMIKTVASVALAGFALTLLSPMAAPARPPVRNRVVIAPPSSPIPYRPSANVVGANSGALAVSKPVTNSRAASVRSVPTPGGGAVRTTDIR